MVRGRSPGCRGLTRIGEHSLSVPSRRVAPASKCSHGVSRKRVDVPFASSSALNRHSRQVQTVPRGRDRSQPFSARGAARLVPHTSLKQPETASVTSVGEPVGEGKWRGSGTGSERSLQSKILVLLDDPSQAWSRPPDRREKRPEPVPPEPYRHVADLDPPFVQQVLDVAQ